jgi:hypothetical protein
MKRKKKEKTYGNKKNMKREQKLIPLTQRHDDHFSGLVATHVLYL